ncbi:lamin-like protein [Panicum virgatum]|nr:lamin-like protein [Panicum virgatum]
MSWLLVVAVLVGFAVDPSAATDHIVGANHGWNPNINYSLWSGNQTFYVGDLISFRYQKGGTHNVFEVNETGYDNCTMDGVAGNWTSGKDFIPLPEARRYYFICGNGFCLQGMKVAITVHPLRHNASSDGSRGSTGAQGEASTAALRTRGAAWLAAIAVVAAAAGAFC